jgi:hypothetical protein
MRIPWFLKSAAFDFAKARISVVTMSVAACIWCMPGSAHDYQREPLFPPQCALREIAAITNIEARGEAQDVPSSLLGEAGLSMLRARHRCYAGHIGEAPDIYDRIIALRPVASDRQ